MWDSTAPLSLSQEKVPVQWKTSCLVSGLLHPPSTTVDQLPKYHKETDLGNQVSTSLGPLQFAYRPEAIICSSEPTLTCTHKASSTVRIMFFDFSSAFNMIQPTLLHEKRQKFQIDASTASWINDYLMDRAQFVPLRGCVSKQVVSSTGASILGAQEHRFPIQLGSHDICRHFQMTLQSVTKELVVDFSRTRTKLNTISILGEEVEVVEVYRYLGVHLDNRLDWTRNTEAVYRKGQSRLYFWRNLRSFSVCSKMLYVFN